MRKDINSKREYYLFFIKIIKRRCMFSMNNRFENELNNDKLLIGVFSKILKNRYFI